MVVGRCRDYASEGSRISEQKRHCQCCVYLDTLLNKLQKVAEIAYTPSIPEITEKLLLSSITLGTLSEHFMT